ncbi:hypothetical protein SORBI_3001G278000 [Sorghum bicolor]|uniref:Uncharacterized protein n=1 Tax=Sorghum bicolor TaxID=4558 RepID=A0A1Z5S7X1_SORBI|nr:hypothetical protein SORBI_3001G278000 [Sorghum bicolor]
MWTLIAERAERVDMEKTAARQEGRHVDTKDKNPRAKATRPEAGPLRQLGTTTMAGIQPGQEQDSHVLPPSSGSLHPDASNTEPNPPSTPLSTIPALTRDKTPATSCNLLSWFRHPLATFTASLKRRRCASSGDNNPNAGRKKKVETPAEEEAAAEAKARQQAKKVPGSDPELLAGSISKAIGATAAAHIVDCLNDDDDVYVKKEDMAIAGEEKAKAKEQQGSPEENVVEKKWVGEPIDDITEGNKLKVAIKSSNKQPESENAEEAAAPATQDTAVTAVSGIREIK